jgi:hypothetical protein
MATTDLGKMLPAVFTSGEPAYSPQHRSARIWESPTRSLALWRGQKKRPPEGGLFHFEDFVA